MKLFKDFQSDSSISWELNPAVRNPKGACIEESNCNWELATVCAFSNSTMANRVSFLACMDESKEEAQAPKSARALLGGGGGGGNALAAAQKCAPGSSVDATALKTCYAGAEGQSLLEAAAKVWNKQFPGSGSVPHTFVNGKNQEPQYSTLKKALCAAGSSAPVCKSTQKCEI